MNSGIADIIHPFFSIIIPTHGSAATINISLQSILNQTYTDFEILIIDGLSKDNTLEIAQSFNDNRIKIISEKDNGIYDAMNKGIKFAKGEWLYFMGSDDTLFNSKVLSGVKSEIENIGNPDILYGNVLWGQSNQLYDGAFDLSKLYYRNICHQSIFYSKFVFENVGGYDLSYPVLADWYFNFSCFVNKKLKVHYVNLLIANFALGGFSGKNNDDLEKNKKKVFIAMAKNTDLLSYLEFKKNTIDNIGELSGKTRYIFYYIMFITVSVFKKL